MDTIKHSLQQHTNDIDFKITATFPVDHEDEITDIWLEVDAKSKVIFHPLESMCLWNLLGYSGRIQLGLFHGGNDIMLYTHGGRDVWTKDEECNMSDEDMSVGMMHRLSPKD
jgi:hypothetical protein